MRADVTGSDDRMADISVRTRLLDLPTNTRPSYIEGLPSFFVRPPTPEANTRSPRPEPLRRLHIALAPGVPVRHRFSRREPWPRSRTEPEEHMINTSALRAQPTLVGKSVRLVPLSAKHTDAYFAAALDEEIRRLTGTHRHLTYAQAKEWCESRAGHTDRLDLAITATEDGRFLGELSIYAVSPENESAGYRIALSSIEFTGQGLGREATQLVLEYAFERIGLHRIWLYVYAFNMRAITVYRSCGFSVEGRLRDSLQWEGRRHDALLMAVLRDRHRTK